MKRNRNPTNKSVMKRYTTLDSSIGSRLLLDRSSFGSRSFFDRFSFILRSSFVRASFGNRRTMGDVSTIQRNRHEETANHEIETNKTEAIQTVIFYYLNSNYYGKTYWNYFQTQRLCR